MPIATLLRWVDRLKETYRGAGNSKIGIEYDAELNEGFSEMSALVIDFNRGVKGNWGHHSYTQAVISPLAEISA